MLSGTYAIWLTAPQMGLTIAKRKRLETNRESMTFIMFAADGITPLHTVPGVIIPPTNVNRLHPLYWMVDACVGANAANDPTGVQVETHLEAEPVVVNLFTLTATAGAVDSPTKVTVNGEVGYGSVTFPADQVDLLGGGAGAVTAKGTVVFGGPVPAVWPPTPAFLTAANNLQAAKDYDQVRAHLWALLQPSAGVSPYMASDVLNEIHSIDPTVLAALIDYRVPCNDAVAQHKTVQVVDDGRHHWVGLLGILNGLLGVDGDGRGPLRAIYTDSPENKLVGFEARGPGC
jgi:hypothetical protein